MKWNEKLYYARIKKGFSQQETATAVGITRACYAHYEQGVREPSLELLKKICTVLDISVDYLLDDTSDK